MNFNKSLELDNNLQALKGKLVLMLMRNKEVEFLKKAVDDILMITDKDFEIYFSISKIFIEIGQVDKLLTILHGLIKNHESAEDNKPVIFLMLAMIHSLNNEKEEANRYFKESKLIQFRNRNKN